jgi:hypothetical protein
MYPKWLAPFESCVFHSFLKWLAPLFVLTVSFTRDAQADLPPAPWHLGQTETSGVPPPQPSVPLLTSFSIDPSTPAFLPSRGASAGSPFALTCGPDELVVGFWGRAGTTVDSIGLSCARLRPNGLFGVPEKRPGIGTAMTAPFALQCPKHEAFIGLRGRAGTKVDRIGVRCARVRPWVEKGIRGAVLQSVGGAGGLPFADECPAGYLLQGIVGFSNGTITAIQGLCVPIVT